MRDYTLKLNRYRISDNAYREMLYFCRQLREKKAKLRKLRVMPSGSPTADGVRCREQMERLDSDIQMIELSAREAWAEIAEYLLRNVADGVRYEQLVPPCGRRQFYEARRRFFCLLAQKRKMI